MAGAFVQLAAENSQSAASTSLAAIAGGVGFASASQTVANPGVFTTVTQAFTAATPVYLTGIAPGGFALNTIYWVIAAGLTTTSCELSATNGGSGIQCTASAACTINPAPTFSAGSTGVVITSQNPGSTATVTGVAGNTYALRQHGGIASFGLFWYECQNMLAGPDILTGHSNGNDLNAIAVGEWSGLVTSGGPLGFNATAVNGPGQGADILTSGTFSVGSLPAMVIGFCVDTNPGGFVAPAGTSMTARGSGVWANLTNGVRGGFADRRVTSGSSYAATFGILSAPHSGDVFITDGAAYAEIGAVVSSTLLGPVGGMFGIGAMGLRR